MKFSNSHFMYVLDMSLHIGLVAELPSAFVMRAAVLWVVAFRMLCLRNTIPELLVATRT
jgi:hypothetical protein